MNATLLLLTWLTPLLLAFPALRQGGRFLPGIAVLPALTTAMMLPNNTEVTVPWLLLGVHLGLDDVSRVFLLFASVLWLAAGLQAALQVRVNAGRFRVFFLLAMSGNFLLIVGQDIVSFYLGFAVMGIAAYGLIVHDGTDTARRAGRIYLIMTLVAELALFAAFLLLNQRTGSINPDAAAIVGASGLEFALLSLAFATKAGLIGVHVWLPLAHPAAPVPASTVLSGVMIKAALVGWLRYLPVGEIALPEWGAWLLVIGALTALGALPLGLVQRDPKVVLAYSSVGKMGIMTTGLGLILMDPRVAPAAVPALALYAAHHGMAKGALFLGVGVVKELRRRWSFSLLLVPAIALAGAPLTSGAVAKELLKGALQTGPTVWVEALSWVLLLATIGTTLVMARFLYLMHLLTQTRTPSASRDRVWVALPWVGLLLALTLLPLAFPYPAAPLNATWPVALGVAIAVAVALRPQAMLITCVGRIPPGDLLEVLERTFARLPLREVAERVWRNMQHTRDVLGSRLKRATVHLDTRCPKR